jgi:hypothetical protein
MEETINSDELNKLIIGKFADQRNKLISIEEKINIEFLNNKELNIDVNNKINKVHSICNEFNEKNKLI